MGRTERLSQPQQFGKYELVARLAHGRMGDVYKAKSHGVEGFEKILVIKVLNPALTQIPNFVDTVIEEAKRTVTLSHANVAQVYDLGLEEESGQYYIAQEYVAGFDLGRVVRLGAMVGRPLNREVALFVMSEVAKGIDYAHRRKDYNFNSLNLLHGDLAPRNVMLSFEGEVKITDFGMARALSLVPAIDNEDIIGRLLYEAPEVLRGQPRTQKADIFGMGLLLYELLTGTHPYRGGSVDEIRARATSGTIAPIASVMEIARPLAQIVDAMLVPDPAGRASSAGSLYEELVAYIFGNNIKADTRALALLMAELRRDEHRVAPEETTMEVGLEEISLTDLQVVAGMEEDSEPSFVSAATNAEIPSKLMSQDQRPALPGPIEGYFANVRSGQGKAVLVSGTFGSGRAYLPDRLPEAFAWRGNTRAFSIQVSDDDRYAPFGVFLGLILDVMEATEPTQALEELGATGVAQPALDTLASLWGIGQACVIGSRVKTDHLKSIVNAIIDRALSDGPFVLVFDRIDQIDQVSLEVLRDVVARIGDRSMMLVMCTQIPEQMRELFDTGRPEDLEAVKVVGDRGPSMESVTGLSPEEKATLAALIIAGRTLRHPEVSHILGQSDDTTVATLRRLTEMGIIRNPHPDRFLAGMPGMMAWVEETMRGAEIEGIAAAIARYFRHHSQPFQGLVFGPAATRWHALAGDRRRMLRDARKVAQWLEDEGWHKTVLDFYEYSADLLATRELGAPQARIGFMLDRAELALKIAEIEVCESALQPVNALSEMLRSDRGAIRGQLLRGQMAMQQDDLVDAFHHFRAAVENARAVSAPELLTSGMLALARWHDRYGDVVAGQRTLDGAMNLYERFGSKRTDLHTQALLMNRAVRILASRGLYTRAERMLSDLRALASGTESAVVSCRADWAEAALHAQRGDFDVARGLLAEARQRAFDHGLTALGIELIREDAVYALDAGQYEVCASIAGDLIDQGHQHRDFYSAQRGHDLLATANCMVGRDVQDALNHLSTSLARARERNVPKDIYRCHVNLAKALEATGRGVDAETHRREAAALETRMHLRAA